VIQASDLTFLEESCVPAQVSLDRAKLYAMLPTKATRYSPVQQDEENAEGHRPMSEEPRSFQTALPLAYVPAGFLIFLLGMALQYALMKSFSTPESVGLSEQPHELFWRPNFRPKTEWIKFQGRLYAPSQYRGTPEKSIDDAWARYTHSPWFDGGSVVLGVSADDIRRSRKAGEDEWFNSTVRLDEQNGGGYMATLEVFHQMHCLVCIFVLSHHMFPKLSKQQDEIRRYTYPEYYQRDTGHHLREHIGRLSPIEISIAPS
jgi:hypothetical protein